MPDQWREWCRIWDIGPKHGHLREKHIHHGYEPNPSGHKSKDSNMGIEKEHDKSRKEEEKGNVMESPQCLCNEWKAELIDPFSEELTDSGFLE